MIKYIPNFANLALDDALRQDKNKPRTAALIRAVSAVAQLKEDIGFDVLVSNNVENAAGALLDRWGAFVRELRGDLDDSLYRGFIRARLTAITSTGTAQDIARVIKTILPDSVVSNFELYPAAFSLIIEGAEALGDDLRERIREFVHDIKPGGVGFDIIEALPDSFTLDAGPGYDVGELARLF